MTTKTLWVHALAWFLVACASEAAALLALKAWSELLFWCAVAIGLAALWRSAVLIVRAVSTRERKR